MCPGIGGEVRIDRSRNAPPGWPRGGSRTMIKVRLLWIASACAVGALLVLGAAQAGGTSSRGAAKAVPSVGSPQAEMVRATERARLRALVEADVTVARQL